MKSIREQRVLIQERRGEADRVPALRHAPADLNGNHGDQSMDNLNQAFEAARTFTKGLGIQGGWDYLGKQRL